MWQQWILWSPIMNFWFPTIKTNVGNNENGYKTIQKSVLATMENIKVSTVYVLIAKYEFLVFNNEKYCCNNEKLEFSALKRSPLLLTISFAVDSGYFRCETTAHMERQQSEWRGNRRVQLKLHIFLRSGVQVGRERTNWLICIRRIDLDAVRLTYCSSKLSVFAGCP